MIAMLGCQHYMLSEVAACSRLACSNSTLPGILLVNPALFARCGFFVLQVLLVNNLEQRSDVFGDNSNAAG
jgi:hypothetical protein